MDTMIVVLLGAAVLTIAVGDGKDTLVILAVVVLNTTLGVYQERKAARAVAELAQLQAAAAPAQCSRRVNGSGRGGAGAIRTLASSTTAPCG